MSDVTPIPEPESPARQDAVGVVVHRLVLPRRETLEWLRLAHDFDEIRDALEHALNVGFCKRHPRRMDYELERIIQRATEARAILRQNAIGEARADNAAPTHQKGN